MKEIMTPVIYSVPCLIDEGETFLVTGGYYGTNRIVSRLNIRVSIEEPNFVFDFITSLFNRYNIDGWIEDLDLLNEARWNHGCGQFIDNSGNTVSEKTQWPSTFSPCITIAQTSQENSDHLLFRSTWLQVDTTVRKVI